jgi:hypothetical protein
MHVAGFDALVAEEHGFKIVNRDGVQMSIPLRGSGATPDNTVGGSCGTSYIYLTASILEYQYYTGFTVVLPAVEYGWQVSMVGPNLYDNNRT